MSLSGNNYAAVNKAFNSTSRYLDDLLNIDNHYFKQMVGLIYYTELQFNKANSFFYTEATFFDLDFSITNGKVAYEIYEKTDDLNFETVSFPFLE